MRIAQFLVCLAALFFVVLPQVHSQEATTIAAIFENKDQFDGKVVTVTGMVAQYKEKTTEDGKPCTVFMLADGGKGIQVYAEGNKGLKNRARVQVTGTFRKKMKVAGRSSAPGIEATDITQVN